MKEKDLFDKRIAFERKLVEVVTPGLRRLIAQNTGEGQLAFLQSERGPSRRPKLRIRK
jgi:hypothetical protein